MNNRCAHAVWIACSTLGITVDVPMTRERRLASETTVRCMKTVIQATLHRVTIRLKPICATYVSREILSELYQLYLAVPDISPVA